MVDPIFQWAVFQVQTASLRAQCFPRNNPALASILASITPPSKAGFWCRQARLRGVFEKNVVIFLHTLHVYKDIYTAQ